jgi:hypothetical protein
MSPDLVVCRRAGAEAQAAVGCVGCGVPLELEDGGLPICVNCAALHADPAGCLIVSHAAQVEAEESRRALRRLLRFPEPGPPGPFMPDPILVVIDAHRRQN